MDTLKKILFSNRLTGVLFIAFAVAMAIGTFMDAGQETSPTPLTRNLIYNAWWFEAIMLLFVINFIGNIFKYNNGQYLFFIYHGCLFCSEHLSLDT